MEKNTVYLSLEEYNKLITKNFCLQEECRRTDELRHNEFMRFEILKELAVKKCVIEYRLEKNTLGELLEFEGFGSAIGKEDLKCLVDAGIQKDYIKSIIQRMKEEQDGKD